MDGTQETLSRRGLFRGQFGATSQTEEGWYSVEGIAAGPGDVFWDGWADEQGVFVTGDDGVIFHFDGSDWTRLQCPAPVPIHALWGTDRSNLWAVGWMGLILRFDGETWHQDRGCVVDTSGKYPSVPDNTPLFDICGLEDGRAWAVGDRGTILHFDGTDWQSEDSGTRAHLRSVIALSGGQLLASGGDGTVLLRGDGGDWQKLDSAVSSNFTAALALGDRSALLVGGRYFVDANGFRGDVVLWNGDTFETLFPSAQFSRFREIGRTEKGIITLGDAGQIHLIREGEVARVQSGTSHDLLGLVCLPTGEALAVGDFGTVLVGDAEALECFAPAIAAGEVAPNWTPQESGTDRQLWGIWCDPEEGALYACGEEGTVLIRDRGQWEALPPAGDLGIHDLTRAPDGGLLAAGQLGEIHHFDGSSWRKHFDLFMDVTILSLWKHGTDQIFAAGDEGLVLHWAGDSWERMPSGTKSALYGLWGMDAEHLLAVGDFGQVMRWNGTRWDEFNAGTEHFLFDVWGRALDDIFIVGLSGTIGHFDGKRWQITPARARSDLLAVTGTEHDVVAVGAAGVAARHDGLRWHMEPTGSTAGLRAATVDRDGRYYAAGDGGTILIRDPS
ncbi:WD40/YVTN/BNR-like repeat-containing protein [Roseobacter sinensis]|uniref:Glycosyl hydrolase n=1 Tax=Roseobacter sinensis TaxID=2931391 RepID=A0ABT3BI21_9RHOB|nr:glycosyl hydrolase [Roseobacter sp. WL0113]MCV3273024.1 glycosyl hydrolase [Roseobacter sp. WL0113]